MSNHIRNSKGELPTYGVLKCGNLKQYLVKDAQEWIDFQSSGRRAYDIFRMQI